MKIVYDYFISTAPNSDLTVTILSGNDGRFAISGTYPNYDITIASALDYETTQLYDLVVQAVDGGTPALTAQVCIPSTFIR